MEQIEVYEAADGEFMVKVLANANCSKESGASKKSSKESGAGKKSAKQKIDEQKLQQAIMTGLLMLQMMMTLCR